MRIVQIATSYWDATTTPVVLGNLARSYRELGCEAVVAAQRMPADWPLRGLEGAPGQGVSLIGGRGGRLSPRRAVKTFLELRTLLRGADVAHFHGAGTWEPLTLAVWLACEATRTPIVATFHALNPSPRPFRAPGSRSLRRLFLSRCRRLTAVSSFLAGEATRVLGRLRGEIVVVPEGVRVDEPFDAAAAREAKPFVLCVGRLAPYKGPDLLLMAWKDVCDQVADVDLLVAGPDHAEGYYEQFAARLGISDRVRFAGTLRRREVWSAMRECLFFVSPSRVETFGNAALEAMCVGKAVIATRPGGPQDFIEDGVSGLLAPAGDVEALREAMLRLLRSPELRRSLGEKAAAAAARLTWTAAARRYLDLAGAAQAR